MSILSKGNLVCAVLLFAVFFVSCKKETVTSEVENIPEITLIMAPQSLGDGGENDLYYYGMRELECVENMYLSVVVPKSFVDANIAIKEWAIDTTSKAKRLLILACENYQSCVSDYQLKNTETSQVLLLGTIDTTEQVYSRMISKYGVSFLAGAQTAYIRGKSDDSFFYVLMANNKDADLQIGADGYLDGVAAVLKDTTDITMVQYVSDELQGGYYDYESIYKKLKQDKGEYYLYPLLGGNNDILAYYSSLISVSSINENMFWVVGTTTDLLDEFSNVLYSIIIRNNNLIYDFVERWLGNEHMEKCRVYGLESEFVSFEPSPLYESSFAKLTEEDEQEILSLEEKYLQNRFNVKKH